MKYFNKLNGERIYLSPMNADDAEIYTKWLNDLAITNGLGSSSRIFSLAKEKEAIEELANKDCNLAIVLKDTDTLIGNISLMHIEHIHRRAELGIFIGEEANRGKGYGTEAIELILSYAFKILNLNNIMLRVFSFNQNAIKSYEKVGFKEFGRRTESYYLNDKYHDDVYMQILKKDYHCDCLSENLPTNK